MKCNNRSFYCPKQIELSAQFWAVSFSAAIRLAVPYFSSFYKWAWHIFCRVMRLYCAMWLTGRIWKCLIFWWWHKVSTNALGLLWLSRNRNNLTHRTLRERNDSTASWKTWNIHHYCNSISVVFIISHFKCLMICCCMCWRSRDSLGTLS